MSKRHLIAATLFLFVLGMAGGAFAADPKPAPAGSDCPHAKEGAKSADCPHAKDGAKPVDCPHVATQPGDCPCKSAKDCPCNKDGGKNCACPHCKGECPHAKGGECPCAKGGEGAADCPCAGKAPEAGAKSSGKKAAKKKQPGL
jgi:hypothetical protein